MSHAAANQPWSKNQVSGPDAFPPKKSQKKLLLLLVEGRPSTCTPPSRGNSSSKLAAGISMLGHVPLPTLALLAAVLQLLFLGELDHPEPHEFPDCWVSHQMSTLNPSSQSHGVFHEVFVAVKKTYLSMPFGTSSP